jgi:hypothetical protein
MHRKCKIFNIDRFLRDYPQFQNVDIELWLDIDNENEILSFLETQSSKLKMILYVIFSYHNNDTLYGKEKVSKKAKNITAMKFSDINNTRVYCKEFIMGGKKIVMITTIKKKSQRNNKAIKKLLETIGGYEYDFKK